MLKPFKLCLVSLFPASKKQRVRFSNIMEVRQLPSTQALEAKLSRMSYPAAKDHEAMLRTVGKLTITDVAKISFFFCFVVSSSERSWSSRLSVRAGFMRQIKLCFITGLIVVLFVSQWFLANLSYQEALSDTQVAIVNILSSTSGNSITLSLRVHYRTNISKMMDYCIKSFLNVSFSSSGLFTLILAAIFPSNSSDRFTLSKLLAVALR